MKNISCFINNKYVRYVVFSGAILVALIPIILSIFRAPIYCDSSFYLSIVNRIADGYIPYKTIALGYTPLYFYMMAALKTIFHLPDVCYEFYLVIQYVFLVANSVLLYKILKSINIQKSVCYFISWLYIISSHWLEGNFVLLEIPSIFWGLLSFYLILKNNNKPYAFIFIGILSAFSFLTKQYGFGFFLLDILLILVFTSNKTKNIFFFLLGYILPILFCFLYWGESFIPLIFSKYGTKTAFEASVDISLLARIESITRNLLYFIIRISPIILCLFFFIPELRKSPYKNVFIIFVFGLLGFSLQFFFVYGGYHYQQYLLPFGLLLSGFLLSLTTNNKYKRLLILLFLVLTTLFNLYSTYYNRVYKVYIKSNEKAEQIKISEDVKSYIPDGETLWIPQGGLYYVYYLTNITPPNLDKISYAFGPLGMNIPKAQMQLDSTNNVLRFSFDCPFEYYFTSEMQSYVEKFESFIFKDSTIILHKVD